MHYQRNSQQFSLYCQNKRYHLRIRPDINSQRGQYSIIKIWILVINTKITEKSLYLFRLVPIPLIEKNYYIHVAPLLHHRYPLLRTCDAHRLIWVWLLPQRYHRQFIITGHLFRQLLYHHQNQKKNVQRGRICHRNADIIRACVSAYQINMHWKLLERKKYSGTAVNIHHAILRLLCSASPLRLYYRTVSDSGRRIGHRIQRCCRIHPSYVHTRGYQSHRQEQFSSHGAVLYNRRNVPFF